MLVALLAGASAIALGNGRGVVRSSTRRAGAVHASAANSVYRHTVRDLDTNSPISLEKYAGCVSLVVNVASR